LEARENVIEDTLSSEVHPLVSGALGTLFVLVDYSYPMDFQVVPSSGVVASSELHDTLTLAFSPPFGAIVPFRGEIRVNQDDPTFKNL